MKFINKKDIVTMFIIVGFSVMIAILYNFIRTDKFPFFKTDIKELIVSDDELFRNLDTENINTIEKIDTLVANSSDSILENIDTISENVDTIIKVDTLNYETLIKNAKKSSTNDFSVITLQQMKKISSDKSGSFVIVDARRAEDYNEAHIGNAINIFPYVDDESILVEQIFSLPKDKTIIVYCDGGNCDASHMVGEMLNNFGYRFFIFEGGWKNGLKAKVKHF